MEKILIHSPHPGEVLRERFLTPYSITQQQLADGLQTSFRTVNEIVNGRRAITLEIGIRLANFFRTSERFWIDLQSKFDIEKTKETSKSHLKAMPRNWYGNLKVSKVELKAPTVEPTESQLYRVLFAASRDAAAKHAQAQEKFWNDVDKEIELVAKGPKRVSP